MMGITKDTWIWSDPPMSDFRTTTAMTPEQALRIIEQERLDVLAEGSTEAECNMIAAYVLASAYRKLQHASEKPYERCFDAAFKALGRLESVRFMWNGPIHEAAALLRDATGPQGSTTA